MADRIMDGAAQIFADRGFRGTGMQDIADAMDMSRPAVYHYFASKEQLLEALVEGITGDVVDFLRRLHADSERSPSERLAEAVAGLAARIAARPAHMRLLAANEGALPDRVAAAQAKGRRRTLDYVKGMIVQGVEAGELRPTDERIAAFALLGMCNWLAWWYRADGPASTDEIGRVLSAIALDGLLHPDPRHRSGSVSHAVGLLREDLDYLERMLPAERSKSSKRR